MLYLVSSSRSCRPVETQRKLDLAELAVPLAKLLELAVLVAELLELAVPLAKLLEFFLKKKPRSFK